MLNLKLVIIQRVKNIYYVKILHLKINIKMDSKNPDSRRVIQVDNLEMFSEAISQPRQPHLSRREKKKLRRPNKNMKSTQKTVKTEKSNKRQRKLEEKEAEERYSWILSLDYLVERLYDLNKKMNNNPAFKMNISRAIWMILTIEKNGLICIEIYIRILQLREVQMVRFILNHFRCHSSWSQRRL